MAEETKVPNPKIEIVCVGKCLTDDGKKAFTFRRVDDGKLEDRERIYSTKGLTGIRVGSVYGVEVTPESDTTIYKNTLQWARLWSNRDEAAAWQTRAAAFEVAEQAKARAKAETSRKLPLELLAPIRREWMKTNSIGRLAIEVQVLAYLRMVRVADSAVE